MNCEKIDECLIDFVEGALADADAAQVRSHLSECPSCRLAARDTREVMGIMDAVRDRQERVWRDQSAAATRRDDSRLHPTRESFSHLGDFEIVEEIGRGGMGVVYRARQVSLNRVVALKVMPAGMLGSASAVARFQKEARAAAKLHHTNIVPVYSQGVHDDRYYYAMELVNGASLGDLLRGEADESSPAAKNWSEIRADMRSVARLIANVADALEHAHRSGVLHRDIKPQNLLLGADRELHITDFGLANVLDEPSVTQTGEMVGTPAYMSPEQVAADPHAIDRRTDIYSLGVTLYEIFTGRRPFEGSTREQLVARIQTTEPVAPCKVAPATPIDLDTICLRALEKDPRRRYQTAGEMAADLRRYADDRPILSRRVSWFEKGIKWVRRHRAMTTIVALVLTISVGLSVWTYQSRAARHREADRLVEEAFRLLAYEDYRDTKKPGEFLDRAALLGPTNPTRFLEVSALSKLLSDQRRAIEMLEDAVAAAPDDSEIQYLLAWALWRDNKKEQAIARIVLADSLGGLTTAAGYFFRAQALVRHQPDEAKLSFEKATLAQGGYAQALLHLARAHNHWTYHHRRDERFSETDRLLRSACDLQPGKAYPRYLRSLANRMSAEINRAENRDQLIINDRFKMALENAESAQQLEPQNLLGFAAEAEYWESLGNFENGIAVRTKYEPLCKAATERIDLYQYRWRDYYWLGRFNEASNDLNKLVKLVPPTDPMEPWYKFGFVALLEAEQGRLPDAQKRIREMTDLKSPRRVLTAASFLRMLNSAAEANALLSREKANIDWTLEPIENAPNGWWDHVYSVAEGSRALNDIKMMLSADADSSLMAPAYFVEACRRLALGNRAGAIENLRACEATYDYQDFSYLARVILGRMEADPQWPAWSAQPTADR